MAQGAEWCGTEWWARSGLRGTVREEGARGDRGDLARTEWDSASLQGEHTPPPQHMHERGNSPQNHDGHREGAPAPESLPTRPHDGPRHDTKGDPEPRWGRMPQFARSAPHHARQARQQRTVMLSDRPEVGGWNRPPPEHANAERALRHAPSNRLDVVERFGGPR